MIKKQPKLHRTPGLIINSIALVLCVLVIISAAMKLHAEPVPVTGGVYDEYLSPKINAYLESVQQGPAQSYINGNLHYSNIKMYCYSFVYGYDTANVYAHATCKEMMWRYYYHDIIFDENGERYPLFHNPVKVTREQQTMRAWSSYIKLTYQPGTDFEFTSYLFPEPGTNYYKTTTEMFGIERLKLPPASEMEQASQNLEARFHADSDDAPMPAYINEIYGQKNPQVIY